MIFITRIIIISITVKSATSLNIVSTLLPRMTYQSVTIQLIALNSQCPKINYFL